MKKILSWWALLIIAVVAYFFKYVLGGVIGDALGFLGLIMLALAIVRGIATIFEKKKEVSKN